MAVSPLPASDSTSPPPTVSEQPKPVRKKYAPPLLGLLVVALCLVVIGGVMAFVVYPQVRAKYHWEQAKKAIANNDLAGTENQWGAEKHLEECLKVWKTDGEVHFLMARTCRRIGGDKGLARAIEYLQKAKRYKWVPEQIKLENLLIKAQAGYLPEATKQLQVILEEGHQDDVFILEALIIGCLQTNFFTEADRWANIWIALFNLLPAYPMDGGRVLRALFSRRMDLVRATRRAVTIGQAFATLFMLVGMLWNIWLTMIGFFLFIAAQLEERSAVFQSVLATVRLEDIMLTDFATLSPADTLEDALEKAVHSLQDDFPVIRGSDMVGVISKRKILEALRGDGNNYVQSAMNRIFEVAQKKESLASAFRKLTARNLSIIPVVEDQRLVGIVTLQNLMHSMALLAESRKLRKEALNP